MRIMKCEEVWLYCSANDKDPRKGHVILDEDSDIAYFIPEGLTAERGWTVSGNEGEVDESDNVWFRYRVADSEIHEAYRRCYEDRIGSMIRDIEYFERMLNELG